jgi:hypothetical protein
MSIQRFSWFPLLLGLATSCGTEQRDFDLAATGGFANSGSGGVTGGSSGASADGGSDDIANGGEAGDDSPSAGGSDDGGSPSAGRGGSAGSDGQGGQTSEEGEGGSAGAGYAGQSSGDAGNGAGGAAGADPGSGAAAGAGGAGGTGTAEGDAGASGEGGAAPEPQPFVCGDPLPAVTFPTVLTSTGTPPAAAGGEITEGLYVLTEVVFYGSYSSVPGDVLAMRPGYFHRQHTTYSTTGSALTGYEEIGTYATTGQAMARDVTACGLGSAPGLWKFTATPSQIRLFWTEGATTRIDTFELQP